MIDDSCEIPLGHVPITDIEKMAAAGMEDFDEDVSDTEDPDLMVSD